MVVLLRILMLEDVATDAMLIEHELIRAGMKFNLLAVETCAGFEQGLLDYRPSLILADYSLPSFDGLSALAIARQAAPEVPFIFVSGAIGEERAIEAMKNGALDYVLKDRLGRLVPAVQRADRSGRENAAQAG